jgi:riboflavin kinase/FMN adenylyltransferase
MTQVRAFDPAMPNLGRAVVALGVFDGVHRGHQALVAFAVACAREQAVRSCVLTFDRDPDQVVTPENVAPQLLTLEDKTRFLAELGPDVVLVVPFTSSLAALSPEEFLTGVLLRATRPVACVVGRDFRFGNRATGDLATLAAFGARHGFEAIGRDLVCVDGVPVTSSRIRRALADGDVAHAAQLLGRPHRITGEVVHGRGAGAGLGVPTANVAPVPYAALPMDGVYAGHALVGDRRWPSAISVGVPPTFPEARDVCEAHLIGYDGPPLYGERITIEFARRLRDQRRFDSAARLASAIRADLASALAALETESHEHR